MKITIRIEDYRDQGLSIEYAIELDGTLWASGDCASTEDGFFKALSLLADAGLAATPEKS